MLKKEDPCPAAPEITINSLQNDQTPSVSILEKQLREKDIILKQQNSNTISINCKIDNLGCCNRISMDNSVIDYWESKKIEHIEMYKLAQVVLAVPASQVSVERAFNALGLVLTNRRTNLSAENINNILICKLNVDLMAKIQVEIE